MDTKELEPQGIWIFGGGEMMLENREVVIIWDAVTLEEAVYLMGNHDGEAYIDGDRKVLVMIE